MSSIRDYFIFLSHGLVLCAACLFSLLSWAYDVEVDSTENKAYVLLKNLNADADFSAINIINTLPHFVDQAIVSIEPGLVNMGSSELALIEFDIKTDAIIGDSGNLNINIAGSKSEQPVNLILTIPLNVVATAAPAQGSIGTAEPTQDFSGIDTDNDGVNDVYEVAFGSDPYDANSTPSSGTTSTLPTFNVPSLSLLALCIMAIWLAYISSSTAYAGSARRSS